MVVENILAGLADNQNIAAKNIKNNFYSVNRHYAQRKTLAIPKRLSFSIWISDF